MDLSHPPFRAVRRVAPFRAAPYALRTALRSLSGSMAPLERKTASLRGSALAPTRGMCRALKEFD